MGAGVFTGIFWGLVVSALVVTAVSLSAPLPTRSGAAPGIGAPDAPLSPDAPAEDTAATAQPEAADATVAESAVDAEVDATPVAAPAVPPALAALQEAQPGPSLDPQTGGPVDAVPLPAGSEFNRPPPEEAPVLPGTDETVTVRAPSAPEVSVPTAPGGVETASAPQPEIAAQPEAAEPAPLDTGDVTMPGAEAAAPTAPGALQPPPLAQLAPDSAAVADAQSVAPPAASSAATSDDAAEAGAPAIPAADATPPEPDAQAPAPVEATVAETPIDVAPVDRAPIEQADTESAAAPEPVEDDAPATPPAVVQLVPPRQSAPLAMLPLDDPPVPDAPGGDDPVMAMPEPPSLLRPADEDSAPVVRRTLPQIVSPARNTPDAEDVSSASDVPVAELDGTLELAPEQGVEEASDLPALEAYSVPFDAAETRPLIAVILIDEPDDRLEIDTLTRFSFPVAFAIDPSRPDAAERAAIYREAGFEVLMLTSVIPEGATATDTEVALSAARARVPEAIALMDTPDSRVQSDRVVLEAAVGTAAGEGQGFVAFPRGLNTGEQMAERSGVPAATLFRLLDDEDQRATVITRFLGRAEFAAIQEGAVVVAGRTRPDTVTALFSWALGNRNEGVAIAPLSAVLGRLAEEE